jgi:hypothetical protein
MRLGVQFPALKASEVGVQVALLQQQLLTICFQAMGVEMDEHAPRVDSPAVPSQAIQATLEEVTRLQKELATIRQFIPLLPEPEQIRGYDDPGCSAQVANVIRELCYLKGKPYPPWMVGAGTEVAAPPTLTDDPNSLPDVPETLPNEGMDRHPDDYKGACGCNWCKGASDVKPVGDGEMEAVEE